MEMVSAIRVLYLGKLFKKPVLQLYSNFNHDLAKE